MHTLDLPILSHSILQLFTFPNFSHSSYKYIAEYLKLLSGNRIMKICNMDNRALFTMRSILPLIALLSISTVMAILNINLILLCGCFDFLVTEIRMMFT